MILDNLNQLKNMLGIGGWNLSTCSYIVPSNTNSKVSNMKPNSIKDFFTSDENTITMLDMSGVLSSNGINPNFESVPMAQLIAQGINDPSSLPFSENFTTPDRKGKTFFTESQEIFSNQLMKFNRGGSTPVCQSFGSSGTTFSCSLILSSTNYEQKLRYIMEILSRDLGQEGGVFNHHIFGKFTNTFPVSASVSSGGNIYNGSVVTIQFFSTQNNGFVKENATKDKINQISSAINDITKSFNVISTLGTVQSQITKANPFKVYNLKSTSSVAGDNNIIYDNGDYLIESFNYNIIGIEKMDDGYIGKILNQYNTTILNNTINQMFYNNIPLDYDIISNTNEIIEICCQSAGVVINNYGTGSSVNSSTVEFYTSDPSQYINSSKSDDLGVKTNVFYQIKSISSEGVFVMTKTTTIITPINLPVNSFSVTAKIDELILVCSLYAKLFPEFYSYFTSLIANIEIMAINSFNNSQNNRFTLTFDMFPIQICNIFGISLDEFSKYNPNLSFFKKIFKNTTINIGV